MLEAQLFHEKQVRPGVTLRELDQNVWDFIEKSLKNSFTDKGALLSFYIISVPMVSAIL